MMEKVRFIKASTKSKLFHQTKKKKTTNNRMELTAVIKAIELLKEPCNLVIYSNNYVENSIYMFVLFN